MKIEFNKVTWYSKFASIIILILLVPVLTFHIGKIYARVYDKVVTPVQDTISTTNNQWSTIDMSKTDIDALFEKADEYIKTNNSHSAPYDVTLDRKYDKWIHLTITPYDTGIEKTQMYLLKVDDMWNVEAYGTSFDEFCTKHLNVCFQN